MDTQRAKSILEQAAGKRVAVVGDLMLDRYTWGTASRISQEAPVPVVQVVRETSSPGGAANVLRNLATLGAAPLAFGVVGDDLHGIELCDLLQEMDVVTDGIVVDKSRTTTQKTRILAGNQQVVRIDNEDPHPIADDIMTEICNRLDAAAKSGAIDAIIVEDYAKGVVGQVLLDAVGRIGEQYDILVAQDPHPGNEHCTAGFTVLTPNRTEAFQMAGMYKSKAIYPVENDAALAQVVARLRERFNPDYLLITLGPGGMVLFHDGSEPLHVPTQAQEVFDVSGAGDTVIASFVLALLAGAAPEECVIMSNHAAGVVVGKVGTAPAYPDEIAAAFALEER